MSAEFIPHGGLIRADDLQQGVPLKPSEITQFIRTIDAEVFERKHAAAENTFQPKSLFDLAKAASEREVAHVLDAESLPQTEAENPREPLEMAHLILKCTAIFKLHIQELDFRCAILAHFGPPALSPTIVAQLPQEWKRG